MEIWNRRNAALAEQSVKWSIDQLKLVKTRNIFKKRYTALIVVDVYERSKVISMR
jgi:hypothetical protein